MAYKVQQKTFGIPRIGEPLTNNPKARGHKLEDQHKWILCYYFHVMPAGYVSNWGSIILEYAPQNDHV